MSTIELETKQIIPDVKEVDEIIEGSKTEQVEPAVQDTISLTSAPVTFKIIENEWQTKKIKILKQKAKKEEIVKVTEKPVKKNIQPLDIAEEWVKSENDQILYEAKSNFLGFVKRNLKRERYTIVHRAYDIIQYLSVESRGFFRIIADHEDKVNNKIASLYEWKFMGNLIYILAIDNIDTESNDWLQKRRDFYEDVAKKGRLDDGSGELNNMAYSILRRNCLKDFVNKFTSTWFYKDFETAKRAITMKVDGHVTFFKNKKLHIVEESS